MALGSACNAEPPLTSCFREGFSQAGSPDSSLAAGAKAAGGGSTRDQPCCPGEHTLPPCFSVRLDLFEHTLEARAMSDTEVGTGDRRDS